MLIILPLVTLFVIFASVFRSLFKGVVKPSHWGLFLSLLYYPVFQILFHSGVVTASTPFQEYLGVDFYAFYIASFCVLVFFLFFALGLMVRFKTFHLISCSDNYFFIVFFLLFLSAFSMAIFIKGYGGVEYVMEYSANIRSGTDPNKSYLGAFFRMFTYYLEFCVVLLYAAHLVGGKRVSRYLIVLFALLPLLFVKLILDSGRAGFISIFVMCFFCYVYIKGWPSFVYLVGLIMLGFVVVVFGKTHIFPFFTGGDFVEISSLDFNSMLNSFFAEFSHPYMSAVVTVFTESDGVRVFGDFFYWILKPLKLFFSGVPDSASYFNTFMITGKWDSMIPPGGVAFSIQQGGYLFVPLVGFFFGCFYSFVDGVVLKSLQVKSPILVAFFSVFTFYSSGLLVGSDIALIVQAFFVFIVLFVIFVIFGVFRFSR